MKDLLAPIESWPVDTASAALIAGGEVATSGDTDRVFELASVTKLLAAYGFLMAVEEGVFELDTPVGPEGSTVRHLLAHASGVGMRAEDRRRKVEDRRVYSSYGFEILGDALFAETAIPFSEYLNDGVFAPLGMDRTTLWGSPGHEARSSVGDLVAFAQELLHPTLLDPSTLAEAWTVQFPDLNGIVPGYGMHKPNPWGLGFEIRGQKTPHWTGTTMPEDTVGHFGMTGTYLWVAPTQQRAMVVLTDRDFGDWAKPLWSEFNDAVWQGLGE